MNYSPFSFLFLLIHLSSSCAIPSLFTSPWSAPEDLGRYEVQQALLLWRDVGGGKLTHQNYKSLSLFQPTLIFNKKRPAGIFLLITESKTMSYRLIRNAAVKSCTAKIFGTQCFGKTYSRCQCFVELHQFTFLLQCFEAKGERMDSHYWLGAEMQEYSGCTQSALHQQLQQIE